MPMRISFPQLLMSSVSTVALTATMTIGLPVILVPSTAEACKVQKMGGIDGVPYNGDVPNPGGAFTCNEFIQDKSYNGVNTTFTTNLGNITLPGLVFLGTSATAPASTLTGSNIDIILDTIDRNDYSQCQYSTSACEALPGQYVYNQQQNTTAIQTNQIFTPIIYSDPQIEPERRFVDLFSSGTFNNRQNLTSFQGGGTPSAPIGGLPSYVPYAEQDGALDDKFQVIVSGLPDPSVGGCSFDSASSCSQGVDAVDERLGQAMDPETYVAMLQSLYNAELSLEITEDHQLITYETLVDDDDAGNEVDDDADFGGISDAELAELARTNDEDEDEDDGDDLVDFAFEDEDEEDVGAFLPGQRPDWARDVDTFYRTIDDDGEDRLPEQQRQSVKLVKDLIETVEYLREQIESTTDPDEQKRYQDQLNLVKQTVNTIGSRTLREIVAEADSEYAPVPGR